MITQQLAQTLNIPGSDTPVVGPLPAGQFEKLADLINNALPLLFAIAGITLFLYLVWGGFDYLTSMGDPKKAESGKHKITNALLGFLIIFVSYWIVQIIDFFLELDVL